jgi:ketosteroid isomerase-like protein
MALTEQDRIDITDLINLHGHCADAGDLDQMDALFTPDVTHDLTDFGFGSIHGTTALREVALAVGDANPVGHHVTNIVITPLDEHSARVRSKGIGIMADGTAGSAVYEDVVTRQLDGWRISYRKATARRSPLGRPDTGPRTALERLRQASINQSITDLREAFAPDSIYEFAFAYPGVPSRFDGPDEIADWTAGLWQDNPLKYERYRTLAIHDTADPNTIVVEQEVLGTSAATGEFVLPNLMVLTARDGRVAHLRDYVNVLAAAAALGQKLP